MEHITDEQLCSFYFQFNFDKTNLCKQDCFILEKRKKKDKLKKKKKIVSDNAATGSKLLIAVETWWRFLPLRTKN